MSQLNWNTFVNYPSLRFQVISNIEKLVTNAYLDTNQNNIPSIGIGFNLREPLVFDAVMNAMGISNRDPAYQQIKGLVQQNWSSAISLDAALNQVMAQRAQASNGAITLTTFTITQDCRDEAHRNG